MPSIARTTDNAQTTHSILLTAGLEMASNSVSRWYELTPAGRRELLAAWAVFTENLAALGVARPTAPKGL